MSFLTIFTAPKPFTDAHINLIQRNAIQSWQHLGDDVEVLLIGKEDGMADVADELGVRHLPDVVCNQWGTPLVSSIFDMARNASNSPVLVYINADVLLMPDFVSVARKAFEYAEKFLVVGRRWDLDVVDALSFNADWVSALCQNVGVNGSLHAPGGSDYFIFSRSSFTEIPDFAIGRAGWDNWMIYRGLQQEWTVIDATESLLVIHQNHDYAHLPDGQMHYDLEETKINAQLGGGMRNMYILLDASHQFVNDKIQRTKLDLLRFIRRLERWVYPPQQQGIRCLFMLHLRKLYRKNW